MQSSLLLLLGSLCLATAAPQILGITAGDEDRLGSGFQDLFRDDQQVLAAPVGGVAPGVPSRARDSLVGVAPSSFDYRNSFSVVPSAVPGSVFRQPLVAPPAQVPGFVVSSAVPYPTFYSAQPVLQQRPVVAASPYYHRFSGPSSSPTGFMYAGGPTSRTEFRDNRGAVVGSFSYTDAFGKVQSRSYSADGSGFRVEGSDIPQQ